MTQVFDPHSTTILAVRRDGAHRARRRRPGDARQHGHEGQRPQGAAPGQRQGLAGFAGGTADAFTLFERFEGKLEKYGNLTRAAIELAKDWRADRYLRRLEALLLVGDPQNLFVISGNGDVIEPEYAAGGDRLRRPVRAGRGAAR